MLFVFKLLKGLLILPTLSSFRIKQVPHSVVGSYLLIMTHTHTHTHTHICTSPCAHSLRKCKKDGKLILSLLLLLSCLTCVLMAYIAGAIVILRVTGDVSITNATFTGNQATTNDGGMFL